MLTTGRAQTITTTGDQVKIWPWAQSVVAAVWLKALFVAGGASGLGGTMVSNGARIAAAEGGATVGSRALTFGGNALIKGTELASQATTVKGALAIGGTYGYGSEAYNAAFNGKQFSFQDATIRSAGTAAALWGAGKTGGLGSFKGSAVYGLAMTAQEQGIEVKNGKELGQAAMDRSGQLRQSHDYSVCSRHVCQYARRSRSRQIPSSVSIAGRYKARLVNRTRSSS